eukprot:COSAG04_NODE_3898_length_2439_cov_1.713675_1_plen_228_part_10
MHRPSSLHSLQTGSATLRHVRLEGQVVSGRSDTGLGAAISCKDSALIAENIEASENTQLGVGAGAAFLEGCNATIAGSMFNNNHNGGLGAGAIYASSGSAVEVSYTRFEGNTYTRGVPESPVHPTNCKVRAYSQADCSCDASVHCALDDNSDIPCCGAGTGSDYMGEWGITDWIDIANEPSVRFIRVSVGCAVDVATGFGGAGTVYTYDESVLICTSSDYGTNSKAAM